MGSVKASWPRQDSTFLPSCCEIISTLRSLTCYEEQPSLSCSVLTLELSCRGILKRPYWFHYNGSFAIQWPQSRLSWPRLHHWLQLCRAGSGPGWSLPSLFLADFWVPPSPRHCYSSQDKVEACNRGKYWRYFGDLLLVTQWFLCWKRAFSRHLKWDQGWLSLPESWEN